MRTMLIVLMLSLGTSAFALEDTQTNRENEAELYLKTTPPTDMMKDAAEKIAMNMPPDRRSEFMDLFIKYLDILAVTKAIKDSMVKHFTADELKALADFYGSPVGKSAMNKFGAYMADAMPLIQAEILKAQTEAVKAQARQKQDKEK